MNGRRLGRYYNLRTGEERTAAILSAEADLIAPIASLCSEIGPDATARIVAAALDAGTARAWERKRADT